MALGELPKPSVLGLGCPLVVHSSFGSEVATKSNEEGFHPVRTPCMSSVCQSEENQGHKSTIFGDLKFRARGSGEAGTGEQSIAQ